MDDGRAKNTSGDTGAPGDLLGALLSDGQLLERVSQIVAKTRAAESSAAGDDTAPPDSSHSNAPPTPVPDLNLLTALFGGMPASPPQNADDSPAVQADSVVAGESGINASAAGAPDAPDASDASDASGISGAPGTSGASAVPDATEATASSVAPSAAPSNAPPDRLAGLTSLLTDSDFMAKLPGVLSMLSSGGGGSAGSGGKDGSNGGSDGRDGGKSGKDGKSVPVGARGGHGGGRGGGDRCIALLSALKPYMSPRRCEAIDYLIRMNRMGDIIRRIR